MDASFATVRKSSGVMQFFASTWDGLRKFEGPINQPLNVGAPKLFSDFQAPIYNLWFRKQKENNLFTNEPNFQTNRWNGYIPSIYKVSNNGYLAFIHIEDGSACCATFPCSTFYCANVKYRVGIAYSRNQGESWTYCGQIISPQYDNGPPTNIGGVPFLIVNDGGVDYFYAYFNDWKNSGAGASIVHAAARAKVSDVVTAAQAGTVVNWTKYNGGWASASPGMGGASSEILTACGGCGYNNISNMDLHSDAAYSTGLLNKYLMTVSAGSWKNLTNQGLLLYSSSDGVNWNYELTVDGTVNKEHPYSTLASFDNASDDNTSIGNTFSIIYPLRDPLNSSSMDLYSRQVTITP